MANPVVEVEFRSQTTQFLQATKKVENRLGNLSDKTDKLKKRFSSMRTALVGIAGAAGFGALIKKSLDSADAIAKASRAAGISTTAFQELSHATSLAGVEQATLRGGLAAFNKRLGELKFGTGTLTTFLKKYDEGFAATLLGTNNTEEALNLFLQRLGEVKDPADRAALASAAFGRTVGIEMTNLLADGNEGLAKAREEAHSLGLVLGEQLLNDAEKANDAMAKLTGSLTTMGQQVTLAAAPAVTAIADGLTAFFGILRDGEALHGTFNMAITNLKAPFEAVTGYIDNAVLAFKKMKDDAVGYVTSMVDDISNVFTGKFNSIVDGVEEKVEAVSGFFKEMWNKVTKNSYVPDMVKDIGEWFDKLEGWMVSPTEEYTETVSGSFQSMGDMIMSTFDQIKSGQEGFGTVLQNLANDWKGTLTQMGTDYLNTQTGGAYSSGVGAYNSFQQAQNADNSTDAAIGYAQAGYQAYQTYQKAQAAYQTYSAGQAASTVAASSTTTGAGSSAVVSSGATTSTGAGAATTTGTSTAAGAGYAAGAVIILKAIEAYSANVSAKQNAHAQDIFNNQVTNDEIVGGGVNIRSGVDQSDGKQFAFANAPNIRNVLEQGGFDVLNSANSVNGFVQYRKNFEEIRELLGSYSSEIQEFQKVEREQVAESLRGTVKRDEASGLLVTHQKQQAADFIASQKIVATDTEGATALIVAAYGNVGTKTDEVAEQVKTGLITAADAARLGLDAGAIGMISSIAAINDKTIQTAASIKAQFGSVDTSLSGVAEALEDNFISAAEASRLGLNQFAVGSVRDINLIGQAAANVSNEVISIGNEGKDGNNNYTPTKVPESGRGGFFRGGIARGPITGHRELLHGNEAVIPLANGDRLKVPVVMNNDSSGDSGAMQGMERKLDKVIDLNEKLVAAQKERNRIAKSALNKSDRFKRVS